jgi:hypothetical protein
VILEALHTERNPLHYALAGALLMLLLTLPTAWSL